MKPETPGALRILLQDQPLAALGTLHRGEPYVSMVPFALDATVPRLLIHVSALAAHTRDMREHPRVSLLVIAPADDELPQARARVTIQGEALPMATDSADHIRAKAVYLARFPQAADIFALPDFSLFAITPASARWIGGFAQAVSLGAESLVQALREG